MVRNSNPELDKPPFDLPENFTQAALGTLDRQLDTALADNPELLVVEMRRVNSIDSAALNWLLATQTRLAGLSIQMLLQNPSVLATDVFIATRLEHRFQIVCSARKPEALDA